MSTPNTVSPEAITLIKRFEGCHKSDSKGNYKSYRCLSGRWTIGYGHTQSVRSGMSATQEECEDFLKEDLKRTGAHIRQSVSVPLTQPQFDALVSFVFSVGVVKFRKSSLLTKLNKGDYNAIPAEIMRWNRAKVEGEIVTLSGLTRRRAAEGSLWTVGVDLGESSPIMPQRPDTASMRPLTRSKTLIGSVLAGIGLLSAGLNEAISYSSTVNYALLAIGLCGVALVTYSRIKDYKEGIH